MCLPQRAGLLRVLTGSLPRPVIGRRHLRLPVRHHVARIPPEGHVSEAPLQSLRASTTL